jgi:hypothetical protein
MISIFSLFKKHPVSEFKNGRCGELKYEGDGKHAAAYYEISGISEFDLLVWVDEMEKWSDKTTITPEEKQVILLAFKDWAKRSRVKCQWSRP